MRRLGAAVAVVLACLIGGGTVAVADPAPSPSPTKSQSTLCSRGECLGDLHDPNSGLTAPAPAPNPLEDMCVQPPEPEAPTGNMAGSIDPGPSSPSSSVYGQFGYAGFGQVVYDPGCGDAALGWLAGLSRDQQMKFLLETVQEGGQAKRTSNGLGTVADVLIATTVSVVRFATGDGPVWEAVSRTMDDLRTKFGTRAIWAWFGFSCFAAGAWFLFRRKLALDRAAVYLARFVTVVMVAMVTASLNVAVGPYIDKGASAVMSQVATTATGDPEATNAGDSVGEALVTHLRLPLWERQHLGYNQAAIDRWGARLHAAAAFTRAEDEATRNDSGARDELVKRKKADFKAVAAEIKAGDPTAYDRLAHGHDEDRAMLALVLLLCVVAVCGVAIVCAAVIGFARAAWRAAFGAAPVGGLVVAHPHLQAVALWVGEKLRDVTIAAGVAALVFVGWIRFTVQGMADDTLGLWGRIGYVAVMLGLLVAVWVHRKEIAERIGLERQYDDTARAGAWGRKKAKKVRERAQARFGHELDKPAAAAARKAHDERREAWKASAPNRSMRERGRLLRRDLSDARDIAAGRQKLRVWPSPSRTTNKATRLFDAVAAEDAAIRRAKAAPFRKAAASATAAVIPQARPVLALKKVVMK